MAGIIDRIGMVEVINQRLGTSPDELMRAGQVGKALLLNGLGFVSAPLYLFSRCFEDKPTAHLLGPGVRPEHLNDDKLARVLDKLLAAGLTSVLVEVALAAAQREGVATDRLQVDASSFRVPGQYGAPDQEAAAIRITSGSSRDRRPDVKQFVLDLMGSGDGGVPCFLRVADGKESDQAVFAELIRASQAPVDLAALFVADAALYRAEHLATLDGLR